MRRLFNILAVAITVVLFAACEKGIDTVIPNEREEIDLANSIQFNTGITTRGQLVMDDYLKDDFAVYGYVYRSSWQAAQAMATPNVFIENAENKTSFVAPQVVTYDAGTYTYSPIVQWTGYKYSFFAYYPAINSSNSRKVNITPSDINVEGIPYVTYWFDRQDPTTTTDLMTASAIDTDANSSKEVQLHFYHRLSAIDVAAVNYCEYDPDPQNNDATDVLPVTIQLFEVSFAIDNLLYDTYKVSLDRSVVSTPSSSTPSTTASFVLLADDGQFDTDIEIEPNKDGDIQMRPITSSEKETTMLVIPQDTPLHVQPVIRYYKRLPDANGKARFLNSSDEIVELDLNAQGAYTGEPPIFRYATAFDFDRGLLEGRRYFIQINFTSDAVSVNIVAADEWGEDINGDGVVDDKDNVYHDFM